MIAQEKKIRKGSKSITKTSQSHRAYFPYNFKQKVKKK